MSLKNITNALAYAIARKSIVQTSKILEGYTLQSDASFLRMTTQGDVSKMLYTFKDAPIIKTTLIDQNGGVELDMVGYPFIVSEDYKTVAIHKGQFWSIVTSEDAQSIGGDVQWVKSPFLASPPKGYRCGIKWIDGVKHA